MLWDKASALAPGKGEGIRTASKTHWQKWRWWWEGRSSFPTQQRSTHEALKSASEHRSLCAKSPSKVPTDHSTLAGPGEMHPSVNSDEGVLWDTLAFVPHCPQTRKGLARPCSSTTCLAGDHLCGLPDGQVDQMAVFLLKGD